MAEVTYVPSWESNSVLQVALVYVLLRNGARLGSWGKMGQNYQNEGRELRKSVEMGEEKSYW